MSSEDPKKWMWFRALSMLEKIEYWRYGMLPIGENRRRRSAWQPPVDMFEVGNLLWIIVALPGVVPKSIRISSKSGILYVRGKRQLPIELRSSVVYRIEIPHGHFERNIELPASHYQLGKHHVIDGCLFLQLHKLV